MAVLKLPQVVPFNLKPLFLLLLLLIVTICSSCKTPVVIETPVASGTYKISPFCVLTLDRVNVEGYKGLVRARIFCKNSYHLSKLKAVGELREYAHLLDTIIEQGAVVMLPDAFQDLMVSLAEAGYIEVK